MEVVEVLLMEVVDIGSNGRDGNEGSVDGGSDDDGGSKVVLVLIITIIFLFIITAICVLTIVNTIVF